MIRQLRRLTRPIPALAEGAYALTIYAEAHGDALAPRVAEEQGFEGVACVDDAARAAVLYATIWQRHRFPWARSGAEGMLRFVCAMQDEGGGFANFILDWDGRINRYGPTSEIGGWPWTARAMHALACGFLTFRTEEYRARFERGLACLDRWTPHMDLRAVALLAALTYWRATGAASAGSRALAWAEEIAACRNGDLLLDRAGQHEVHLWGHLQEAAVAEAGIGFGRADLIDAARRSADALLLPAAAHAFAAPRTLPFDVSCTVRGLDAVALATGDPHYAVAAARARAWFGGRNRARRTMYDRRRGLVYDGIDGTRRNANSGAESNIEGALALLDDLPWHRYDAWPAPAAANAKAT